MYGTQYLLWATALVFVVELVCGELRGGKLRDYALTGACYATNMAVTRPLAAALIAFVLGAALPAYKGALADTPFWLAYLVAFTLAELSFYWVHRWTHEARGKRAWEWAWKIHRTHHSAQHLDVSVTMRQNIFWTFIVPIPWVLGAVTYLGHGKAAAFALITTYGWNLITHSHFRWDDRLRTVPVVGRVMRAVEHVIVSPGMHHTHHGYGGADGKMYKNYAVTLALFDWMFGSLHIPKGRPARYGVPEKSLHWAEEMVFPLYWARTKPPVAGAALER